MRSHQLSLVVALLGLSALAAPPTVQSVLQRAGLAPCLSAGRHPEDAVRVSLVVYPDGAWAVGLSPFEDAPPEALQRCVTEVLREALEGVAVPHHRELVFERTIWPATSLRERFDERREAIVECSMARLPKVDHLVVRLRLSTTATGALKVETTDSQEVASCVRKHVVALLPAVDVAEVELQLERPGAPPRHDGTAGAVCQWSPQRRRDTPALPQPRACRRGLVCLECPGGAQLAVPVEVDLICLDESAGCPPVP